MSASLQRRRRWKPLACAGAIGLAVITILGSCRTMAPPPHELAPENDREGFPVIARRTIEIHAGHDGVRNQTEQRSGTTSQFSDLIRNVRIEGDDILLPQRELSSIAAGTQYSFYVFAHGPNSEPIAELLEKGDLRIEVIGAEYKISFPLVTAILPKPLREAMNHNGQVIANGSVAKLTFRPEPNKPLRPFTILAWFPARFNGNGSEGASSQKWSARRDVKVYYGDIRTRVQIVSQNEAAGLFGRHFAQNYYVGRVFLRNRSDTQSLAVYTTSMRVPVVFYRKTIIPGGLSPTQAAELDERARDRFWQEKDNATALTAQDARDLVLKLEHNGKLPRQSPAQPRTDERVQRVLATWAQLLTQPQRDPRKLSPEQTERLLSTALATTFGADDRPQNPAFMPGESITTKAMAELALKDTLCSMEQHLAAYQTVDAVLQQLLRARSDALHDASERRRTLATDYSPLELPTAPPAPAGPPQPTDAELAEYNHIKSQYDRLHGEFGWLILNMSRTLRSEPIDSIASLDAWQQKVDREIDQLPNDADRRLFTDARTSARNLADSILRNRAVADALSGRLISSDLRAEVERVKDRVGQKVRLQASGTPFNEIPTIPVNLNNAPLALSRDPVRQMQLLESGYLWRETFRPMTFQSVLSGIMSSHDNDKITQRVVLLESLAKIAGGAVGLGGVIGEFGRSGYLQTTNFFNSVLAPSLRGLLVEDLRKLIITLGDTAMDTVMIIRPHESVDRYVFFPRGAIYNFPDEFDATTPAYIAGIEGDDLFVEALPINQDEVVRGGAIDAGTLVARALNEGERTEQARLFDIAQTQSRLRTVELGNLVTQVDAIINAVPPNNPTALGIAQREVLRRVANFTAYFGPDQSGTLSAALAKYGLAANDTPPNVVISTAITLPVGAVSKPIPLQILDVETNFKNLNIKPKKAGDQADWLVVKDDDIKKSATGITITLETKPDLKLTADTQKSIDYLVEDEAAHTTPFTIPVVLKKWTPTATLLVSAEQITLDARSNEPLKRQVYVLQIETPLHDADGTKLKIVLKSQSVKGAQVTGIADAPVQASDGNPPMLKGSIIFDTSKIVDPTIEETDPDKTTVPFELVVAFKRGEAELNTQTYTWRVKRKVAE